MYGYQISKGKEMEIVAQVYDWKITRTELDFEVTRVKKEYPQKDSSDVKDQAIKQLIDRYLLMQEAMLHDIGIADEEFEQALMDLLEGLEDEETSILFNQPDRHEQIELILKSNLIVHKYIKTLDIVHPEITEDMLYEFYLEHKDFFRKKEEVRISHILIKGNDEAALKRIWEIRNSIKTMQDFINFSKCESHCPSGANCGDLGYFPRGRMIPAMEKVAFSLMVNDISQPFETKSGYHILMVTDRKTKQIIPFEAIRDCLSESLREIEEEIAKSRILADIRARYKDAIRIFDNAFE
ncbi:MAG: peptidylprolyl isomerase [Candidatus Cloacimonadaceae bacterium]